MIEFRRTRRFNRDFLSLPRRVQDAAAEKLELFALSPRYPSLRLKRVGGTENLWEISVTMQHRITLEFLDETHAELRQIGTHKVLDQP